MTSSRRAFATAAFASALFVAGCTTYTPHVEPPIDEHAWRQVGCIHLGLFASRDGKFPESSIYLEVHLENICSEPVPFSLERLRIAAHAKDGSVRAPVFYDPRNEIVSLLVEPHRGGVERLRLDGAGDPGTLEKVCFDAGSVAPTDTLPAEVCFDWVNEPREPGSLAPAEEP